jgi:ribosome-binding protein aMBF1 (putative translation factor)
MKCQLCGEEVDELVSVTTASKRKRVCEDCASQLNDQAEIADEATTAMKGMMEYKGGRR